MRRSGAPSKRRQLHPPADGGASKPFAPPVRTSGSAISGSAVPKPKPFAGRAIVSTAAPAAAAAALALAPRKPLVTTQPKPRASLHAKPAGGGGGVLGARPPSAQQKAVARAAASARGPTSAAPAAASGAPPSYFRVMYCKRSKKKRKTYDDGFLELRADPAMVRAAPAAAHCSLLPLPRCPPLPQRPRR